MPPSSSICLRILNQCSRTPFPWSGCNLFSSSGSRRSFQRKEVTNYAIHQTSRRAFSRQSQSKSRNRSEDAVTGTSDRGAVIETGDATVDYGSRVMLFTMSDRSYLLQLCEGGEFQVRQIKVLMPRKLKDISMRYCRNHSLHRCSAAFQRSCGALRPPRGRLRRYRSDAQRRTVARSAPHAAGLRPQYAACSNPSVPQGPRASAIRRADFLQPHRPDSVFTSRSAGRRTQRRWCSCWTYGPAPSSSRPAGVSRPPARHTHAHESTRTGARACTQTQPCADVMWRPARPHDV
jgi:hypothetical protein